MQGICIYRGTGPAIRLVRFGLRTGDEEVVFGVFAFMPVRWPLLLFTLVLSLGLFSQARAQGVAEIPLEQLLAEAAQSLRGGDFANAADVLGRIVQRTGLPPAVEENARYNLASAVFQTGDFARAVQLFQEYVQRFPQGTSANDARMARAISFAMLERWAEAATAFRDVETVPSLRATALGYRAECAIRAGDTNQAVEALEALLSLGLRDGNDVENVFTLIQLYLDQGNLDRAERTLIGLNSRSDLVDNLIRMNAFLGVLGDRRIEGEQFAEALNLYQMILPRDELILTQRSRIQSMEASLRQAETINSVVPAAVDARRRLAARLELTRTQLAEVEGAEDYDTRQWFRMGRAFLQRDRPWEAILLLEEIVNRFPRSANTESALFALARAYVDVNQRSKALEVAQRFRREFPNSQFADQVTFIAGQAAFERGDFAEASSIFTDAIDLFPKSELKQQMLILLANARFLAGEMFEARLQFRSYIQEFPDGMFVEDAFYRMAMAGFFAGDFNAAVTDLRAYLEKFPNGNFVADAGFRLAVCTFSTRDYKRTLEECSDWLARHTGQPQTGDIHSLMGDAFRALGLTSEAITSYQRAIETASSEDVVGYAMMEITRILQSQGDFQQIATMYEAFVRRNPESSLVPGALYWISRARAREGQVEEAGLFIAENVARFIGDPSKEGVEKMLTQLAQIITRRPRVLPGQVRPPPPTLNELLANLDRMLAASSQVDSNTARARILFTRAEVARLIRLPSEEQRILDSLAETFTPDDLSAALLATVGLRFVERGELERAEPYLTRLIARFPKAETVDAGYVGLGEIAFQRGDFNTALKFFQDAIDRGGAQTRAREATVGQARALLALRRLDEAEKIFQQVAASREWRGEVTAEAIFSLGEIAKLRNNLPAAQAFFQRVYLSQGRYPRWVARAYLESGLTFESLSQNREALNTYREMLNNARLAQFPEVQRARERIQLLEARIGTSG